MGAIVHPQACAYPDPPSIDVHSRVDPLPYTLVNRNAAFFTVYLTAMTTIAGATTGWLNNYYLVGMETLLRDALKRWLWEKYLSERHPIIGTAYFLWYILVFIPVAIVGIMGPALAPFIAVPVVQKVSLHVPMKMTCKDRLSHS